jgi:hypothetical protein
MTNKINRTFASITYLNHMKNKQFLQRLILISFLFISSISFSYGQAALIVLILGDKVATEQFHLSIDGALNLSGFSGLEESKMGAGVNFGLGTHIKLGEKWHLKPEFKPLSRKKATSINTINSVPGVPDEFTITDSKVTLNYIDVPVFLQYNITPQFYVSAGPQVSFLTSASQFSTGKLEDGKESTVKIDTKAFFNTVNFSFPIDAGYTLKLATKRSTSTMDINIFARYEYGFLEIFKDPESTTSKISLFQIGLSMPFIKSPEELAAGKK